MQDETLREAMAVVNSQPFIGGIKKIDSHSEEVLSILLSHAPRGKLSQIRLNYEIFPEHLEFTYKLAFEKLKLYGLINYYSLTFSDVCFTFSPKALTYFEDIARASALQEDDSVHHVQHVVNHGNMFIGNIVNSSLSLNNCFEQLEKDVSDKGQNDKEELHRLLSELKEYVKKMSSNESLPKPNKLLSKIKSFAEKYPWLLEQVASLLGKALFCGVE